MSRCGPRALRRTDHRIGGVGGLLKLRLRGLGGKSLGFRSSGFRVEGYLVLYSIFAVWFLPLNTRV